MDDVRVMELLQQAVSANFKVRNDIGIELAHEIEKPDLVAVFNLLYVQFCQEAPSLLPMLYPFVAAVSGDRAEGMFAGRIEMAPFTNLIFDMNAQAIRRNDRMQTLREHNLRGGDYAGSHPKEDSM